MTIDLSPELEERLREKARESGLDVEAWATNALRGALLEAEGATKPEAPRRQTISERFEAIRRQLSPEEQRALDDLPTDFAAEHDHYIYGSPKRES